MRLSFVGKFVHTEPPVVLWMDPDGYAPYRARTPLQPDQESDWAFIPVSRTTLTALIVIGLRTVS